MTTDYGGWGSFTMGLIKLNAGYQKNYGIFGLKSSSDTENYYNMVQYENYMCDYTNSATCTLCTNTGAFADPSLCPLASSYYPTYVAVSLFPNTWDSNLSSSYPFGNTINLLAETVTTKNAWGNIQNSEWKVQTLDVFTTQAAYDHSLSLLVGSVVTSLATIANTL